MYLYKPRNSKITITDNKLTNVATAVIDYSSESDLVIKGNNLSFSEGESSDEIAFDLALNDGYSLLMEDNYIEQYDVGLLIYECSFGSSMTIRNNTIEGSKPILLLSIGDYQMGYQALSDIEGTEPIDIEISKNRLLAKEAGIIVGGLLDSETNPINLIISDNIISSDKHGFAVSSSIELNNPSSAVMIVGNKINAKKSNILVFNEPYWAQGLATTMALTDLEIMEEGQDILPLIVRYNSLSNEAAVDNWAEGNLDIRLNWWGSDEGPDQDLLLGNILYDPWMASLDLDASIEDGKVTALFSLLDSDGEKISDQGLSIRFTVSGANSLTQDIAIIDGLARLEYDSTADGTDTIKAELVFAGETDGLEVEETLKVNSKEPEESPEPTDEPQESPEPTEEPKESPSPSPTTDTDGEKEEVPKTGDKSLSLVYYGLLLALSGLVLFYKRVRTLKAK
jgi:LPXTG-motif cell wall-anchored protein